MSITILYLWPLDARDTFHKHAEKWVSSYKAFPPGMAHEVLICMSNGTQTKADRDTFKNVPHRTCDYDGGGWDIGAYQAAAKECHSDLMVFMNGRTHFWTSDWLTRFVEAFEKFGPKGLYGASGSYECCPPSPTRFPNPHIRTSCFATDPKLFRCFPFTVDSRADGFRFESCEWNFCRWYADHGWPVKMVAADGFYDRAQWRKPDNIFRRGDQSNMLVRDRHTDVYFAAGKEEKMRLDRTAGLATVNLNGL
jgi:hypothetical protein